MGCSISPIIFTAAFEIILIGGRQMVRGIRSQTGQRLPAIPCFMDDVTTKLQTAACTTRLLKIWKSNPSLAASQSRKGPGAIPPDSPWMGKESLYWWKNLWGALVGFTQLTSPIRTWPQLSYPNFWMACARCASCQENLRSGATSLHYTIAWCGPWNWATSSRHLSWNWRQRPTTLSKVAWPAPMPLLHCTFSLSYSFHCSQLARGIKRRRWGLFLSWETHQTRLFKLPNPRFAQGISGIQPKQQTWP